MNIYFILVEPKVPENIGASARAIKTMGFNKLCLVKPCSDPEGKARWLAHGSADILDNAEIYNSLEEAVKEADLVIATTARNRGIQRDIIESTDLDAFIQAKTDSCKNLAVVFGREESGLSNEEIRLCDVAAYIPMAGSYPSLNLSQSVMVIAYEISKSGLLSRDTKNNISADNSDSLRLLKSKIDNILNITGISKNQNLKGRILERAAHLSDSDIKLLHSVSGALIEKLGEEKE